MSNKNKKRVGVVYSTADDYSYESEGSADEETLDPGEQKIRVMLERKGRGGKEVTFLDGLIASQDDKEALAKKLKSHCGSGGSAKDGEVMIQGDHRDKVVKYLLKEGYTNTKRGN